MPGVDRYGDVDVAPVVRGVSGIAFFHAHPDDESIFTGGTMALLVARGVHTVLVLATGGEHGVGASPELGSTRAAEARAAAAELGVAAVYLLGYVDSGGRDTDHSETAFASAPIGEAASLLATVLRNEGITTLVVYDEGGIYAHPDHLAVHRVGHAAAQLAGIETVYEATVDREYLHFVETHVVADAVSWLVGAEHAAALNRAPLGVPTVEVTHTVDVRSVTDAKRRAIVAHTSQIPADSRIARMPADEFEAVYGSVWFIRRGGPGPLDELVG